MKILIACEYSQIVTKAFRDKGHEAYSCDIIDCEINPDWHFKCDVRDILEDGWDMLIGHPVCQFLTNAGVRHLHDHVKTRNGNQTAVFGSQRWVKLFEAAEFFNTLKNAPIPKIALENPIPHKYAKALIGDYTQIIQPWQFGTPESKGICLWLRNLPKLVPIIKEKPENLEHRVHMMAPGPDRAKERSRFFPSISKAMAEQWG